MLDCLTAADIGATVSNGFCNFPNRQSDILAHFVQLLAKCVDVRKYAGFELFSQALCFLSYISVTFGDIVTPICMIHHVSPLSVMAGLSPWF